MFCYILYSITVLSLCKVKSDFIKQGTELTSTYDSKLENDKQLDEIWKTRALQDIAHYLRNHKFNEWDRRFYSKRNLSNTGFYAKFPEPKLRSLHWEVHENCYNDFYNCIIYLHKYIEIAPFNRKDDITTFLNNENSSLNVNDLGNLNQKCKDVLEFSDITGLPFDGPQERFIWRVTASYFMCWYTMREIPDLALIGESCDNFANCLDPTFGNRNFDPRAQDKNTFNCALYSFCPDPCCPLKYIKSFEDCENNPNSPCSKNNSRFCKLIRKENQNFDSIILNGWNITCLTRHNRNTSATDYL